MMNIVGRKQYHAWGEDLTIGIGLMTTKWSSFVRPSSNAAIVILYNLHDTCGEIVPSLLGPPKANLYGRNVNDLLTTSEAWMPKMEGGSLPIAFCGRRLITTWSDTQMLILEKLVGPPSRFGVEDQMGSSAMLFDVVEVLGELTEVRVGRPVGPSYGKDPNFLTETSRCWLAEWEVH